MKKIFTILAVLGAALAALTSCDSMDASIQEYIEEGPVIYIGKIDSLKVLPGNCQAKLVWAPSSDSRIKEAVIYWNNRENEKVVAWDPKTRFETVVDGLSEGSVLFEVVTRDAYGNVSIPVSASGNIFGESFQGLIDDKATITGGLYDADQKTVQLYFSHSSNYYYAGLQVIYTDVEGAKDTVLIAKDRADSLFQNVGSPEVFYRGTFSPAENCIDVFTTETHLYEDLFNPSCEKTSDDPKVSYCSAATGSFTYQANRAPIEVVVPDGCWLTASAYNGTVTVTTTSANSTGADRTTEIRLKAGSFELPITVTQVKDPRGTAYKKEGVIFWQDPADYRNCKIVSATRGDCKWSTDSWETGSNSMTGISASPVAGANLDILAAEAVKYPGKLEAFEWCRNLGAGWYFPCGNEWKLEFWPAYDGLLFDVANKAPNNVTPSKISAERKALRTRFEDALVAIEGVKINTQADTENGDWYWANQEYNKNTNNAYALRTGIGGYGNRSKQYNGSSTDKIYVRAFKLVDITK